MRELPFVVSICCGINDQPKNICKKLATLFFTNRFTVSDRTKNNASDFGKARMADIANFVTGMWYPPFFYKLELR